eukprot:UN02128
MIILQSMGAASGSFLISSVSKFLSIKGYQRPDKIKYIPMDNAIKYIGKRVQRKTNAKQSVEVRSTYFNQLFFNVNQQKISKTMDVDSDAEEVKKISLPRKPKDDKCPKRTLTAYFLYAKEVRDAIKVEFPHLPITRIAKEISKKWNVLTEDEKKPYNEEAARLKEQYKVDLSEYQGTPAHQRFQIRLAEWKQECDRRRMLAKAKLK